MTGPDLRPGSDGLPRCRWCAGTPEFERYHDTEWGFPVAEDRRLFERLCLESLRGGLSWRAFFARREHYRRAFDDFDIHRIAGYDAFKIRSLLQNGDLIRNRERFEAVIHNAGRAQKLLAEHTSLAAYFRQFEVPRGRPAPQRVPTTSPEATELSKDLKRRGWKFVTPTVVQAFMQVVGLVNDHVAGCVTQPGAEQARDD